MIFFILKFQTVNITQENQEQFNIPYTWLYLRYFETR